MISIEDIHLKLGPKRSAALLGLHAFTGCDVTGRFGGRTKDWCFKEFLSCDDGILDALGNLGTEVLDPGTWAELERFVCLLYRSKLINADNVLYYSKNNIPSFFLTHLNV